MSDLEKIDDLKKLEEHVQRLSPEELKQFRAWFAAFDARTWDAKVGPDSGSGELNALVSKALVEHSSKKLSRWNLQLAHWFRAKRQS